MCIYMCIRTMGALYIVVHVVSSPWEREAAIVCLHASDSNVWPNLYIYMYVYLYVHQYVHVHLYMSI